MNEMLHIEKITNKVILLLQNYKGFSFVYEKRDIKRYI